MNFEVYPQGLKWAIERAGKYGKPVIVTENGYEHGEDTRRGEFIKKHVEILHECIKEGADVRGYFYWTLMDNFEWAWGYGPRLGLMTRDRRPKNSAWEYRKMGLSNDADEEEEGN